jgi:hypothetical protein
MLTLVSTATAKRAARVTRWFHALADETRAFVRARKPARG